MDEDNFVWTLRSTITGVLPYFYKEKKSSLVSFFLGSTLEGPANSLFKDCGNTTLPVSKRSMLVNLDLLLKKVAGNPNTLQRLNESELKKVWNSLVDHVYRQLLAGRGVNIKEFGNFSFVTEVREGADGYSKVSMHTLDHGGAP